MRRALDEFFTILKINCNVFDINGYDKRKWTIIFKGLTLSIRYRCDPRVSAVIL